MASTTTKTITPATAPAVPDGPAPASTVATDERVAELERENEELRRQLAEAGKPVKPGKPAEPSFRISEGTRQELATHGTANSPFTGAKLTAEETGVERVGPSEAKAKAKSEK